jgi:transposase InsO family protein
MRIKHPDAGMEKICRIYNVTRQAFYSMLSTQQKESLAFAIVLVLVKEIRSEISGIGTRKLLLMMLPEFKRHGIKLGRDQLFDLLRIQGLLIRRRKRIAKTTDSFHWLHKYPNLVKELILTRPEELWVSDITYLRTSVGFSYLSLITDAYSRKIVGYALHPTLEAIGCLAALKMAERGRQYRDLNLPLIHHSDRGIQYCSATYVTMLQIAGISISMTQTGSPYDNALAERVNETIKGDYFPTRMYDNHATASVAVDKIIRSYNGRRPHQSIGYLTPQQAHDMTTPFKKLWKKYPYKRKGNRTIPNDAGLNQG